MLRRIAGTQDVAALRTLADVLEPAKGYSRFKVEAAETLATTPLNRLVDAVRPESLTGRHFTQLVSTFLAGSSQPETETELRAWLTRWRDNDAILRPADSQSFLLREAAPVSRNLSAVAAAGLRVTGLPRPPRSCARELDVATTIRHSAGAGAAE